ncbi:hypothetical protein [Flavobacterium urocaniciphilum]|uniref:Lipoprotein n=1 Tax=Flavobacterium urocaniciphilum TaxID=1299341 RepID=A0A1H8YZC2_9FLAO|nr:hypothetical protein [Flavobacterium urocaniciphilum]SEP57550.1 hypothetical protein SAMN05444005_101385 [Flavobacterium urocaniciphilum]
MKLAKVIFSICFSIIISSCEKKEQKDIELIILNKKLSFDCNNSTNEIIKFKLINNSNKTYYFNASEISPKFENKYLIKDGLIIDNVNFVISDGNKNLKFSHFDNSNFENYLLTEKLIARDLVKLKRYNYNLKNYNSFFENKNFALHPKEVKNFEIAINLPKDNYYLSETNLKENKKYNFKIQFFSDTINNKNKLTRVELLNISNNNYSLFHGSIESSNEITLEYCKQSN